MTLHLRSLGTAASCFVVSQHPRVTVREPPHTLGATPKFSENPDGPQNFKPHVRGLHTEEAAVVRRHPIPLWAQGDPAAQLETQAQETSELTLQTPESSC